MGSDIFISATQARQNAIADRVVHTEGRLIEDAILDAAKYGLFGTVVSGGTPMTQANVNTYASTYFDPTYNIFQVPGHPWGTGSVVNISSSGQLPDPFSSASKYYVIFIDPNNIKLASSLPNALQWRSISVNPGFSVSNITLTDIGDGYSAAPSITISGGNANIAATATATLGSYGSINSITVLSNGGGYTDVPTVTVTPLGSNALVGTVTMCLVGATPTLGGTGYSVNDTLGVTGGTGSQAQVIVTQVGTNGSVTALTVANAGAYMVLPTLVGCATTAITGSGTGCTLNLNFGLLSIAVAQGGYYYLSAPFVSIVGTGQGAAATASVTYGAVTQVVVSNTGSGYTAIPTVTFVNGQGANVSVILQSTGLGNITLTNNGGNTYTATPNVTVSPLGSGATVGTISMSITGARLGYTGQGYLNGDVVSITGGICSTAAQILVTRVGPIGEIFGYTLISSGVYTILPVMDEVGVTGGTGFGATFHLKASLYDIAVGSGGGGYLAPPQVIITDNTGMCATATATITNGSVSSYIVTSIGQCYTDIPNVNVSNGGNTIVIAYLTPTSVASFVVSNIGSGYTMANITVTGSTSNTDANGTVVLSNGTVSSVSLVSGGGGYTGTPNVIVNGDGMNAIVTAVLTPTSISNIAVLDPGQGFGTVPNVTIDGNAIATGSLAPTGIAQLVVNNAGNSYTSNPTITVTPALDQNANIIIVPPNIVTTVGYSLGSISITDGGSGYTSAPIISISAPQTGSGNTAIATANIGVNTGSITIGSYPPAQDYYAVWKGYTPSDPNIVRPYQDRMTTIINYFTGRGYTITQQTNPNTGNTMQWLITW